MCVLIKKFILRLFDTTLNTVIISQVCLFSLYKDGDTGWCAEVHDFNEVFRKVIYSVFIYFVFTPSHDITE